MPLSPRLAFVCMLLTYKIEFLEDKIQESQPYILSPVTETNRVNGA